MKGPMASHDLSPVSPLDNTFALPKESLESLVDADVAVSALSALSALSKESEATALSTTIPSKTNTKATKAVEAAIIAKAEARVRRHIGPS